MTTGARSSRAGSAKLGGLFCQFRPESLAQRSCRVTSLQYSPSGSELLVSYCADYVYLFTLCGQKQTPLSSDGQDKENGYHSNGQRSVPPLKRLRLRGDWSDTGPNARPESEHGSPESSLMQRMSEMFSRWLEQSFRDGQRRRQRSSSSSRSTSASSISSSSSPSYFSGSSSSESGGGTYGEETTRTNGRVDRQASLGCPTVTESTTETSSGNCRVAEESQTSQQQDGDVSAECSAEADVHSKVDSDGLLKSETVRDLEKSRKSEDSVVYPSEVEAPMEVNSAPPSALAKSAVTKTSNTNSPQDSGISEKHPEPSEFQTELNSEVPSALLGRTCDSERDWKSNRTRELCSNRSANASSYGPFELTQGPSSKGKAKRTPGSMGHSKSLAEERSVAAQTSKYDSSEDEPSNPILLTGSRSRKRAGNSSDGHLRREVVCDEENRQVATSRQEIPPQTESRNTGSCSDLVESVTRDTQMRDSVAVTQGRTDVSGCSNTMNVTNNSDSTSGGNVTCQSGTVTQRPSAGTEDTEGGLKTRGKATPCEDRTTRRSDNEESDSSARKAAATSIQRLYRQHRSMRASQSSGMGSPEMTRVYKGHRNSRTMIKEANFYGDRYVLSGSDCGRIFFWDKHTAEIVMIVQGDRHVVNCVQPHPFYPVIASSGIDYDVKIWEPSAREPADLLDADEIVRRNEKMLEEGRDTLTVPASFMIRMLASLNRAMPGRGVDSDSDSSDD